MPLHAERILAATLIEGPMKIHFCQHGLRGYGGHYLSATRAWRAAVEAAGLTWRGYAHQSLPAALAAALDVVPLFAYLPYAEVDPDPISREITDLLYLSEQFGKALALVKDVAAEDIVVVDFCSEREIYGVARWLRMLPADKRPRVAACIHMPDASWTTDADRRDLSGRIAHWRFAINQLRASIPAQRIVIGATDPRLATFLTTILGMPTRVIVDVRVFDPDLIAIKSPAEFDVIIAGGWRSEKGAELISEVLLGLKRSGRAMRVAVQVDTDERARLLLDTLKPGGGFSLDLVTEDLPPADYFRRLCKSRLVLLAYAAKMYALRCSGIANEAWGYGIPVIAPAKTWMSDRIEDETGTGALFYQFHPLSIVATTLRALDEVEKLGADARARAPGWRERHGGAAALATILGALDP